MDALRLLAVGLSCWLAGTAWAGPDDAETETETEASAEDEGTEVSAPAPEPARDERDTAFHAEWRWALSRAEPFPLNADGERSGLGWTLDQRLRLGMDQEVDGLLRFEGELELLAGQVAGDFDHLAPLLRRDERETLRGWDLKNAELRRFSISWRAPWFELRAGQMSSHFGLGLLANDGRDTPERFGPAGGGDLSDRLVLATRPFASLMPDSWAARLVLAIGGGVVYRDENADLREGDVGGEALLSLFYREPGLFAGFYMAGRFQEDDDGDDLDVVALDLSARWEPEPGQGGPLLAAEVALLVGHTTRLLQAERLEGVDVLASGGVARAGWRFVPWEIEPVLEVGYASGDSNLHDGRMTQFSFDPNLRVGLVLFDHVLRALSAMAAAEAADPDRVAEPLPGVDQLATGGRVSNAVYLFPTVRLRPLENLCLRLGLLGAWSAVDLGQAYQTFKNGGVPTNAYGKAHPGRELGWEVDMGLTFEQPFWERLRLVTSIEAGWFFPGAAFERPDGSRPETSARVLAWAALVW
jgi:hypothetical protein